MRNLDSIDLGVNFAVIHDRPGARRYLVRRGMDGNVAVVVVNDNGDRAPVESFYSFPAAIEWIAGRLARKDTRA